MNCSHWLYMSQLDGQSDFGNDYATMRLLQLASQTGTELLAHPGLGPGQGPGQGLGPGLGLGLGPGPGLGPTRHSTTDDGQHPVEHIYESPDSLRRMPQPPGADWRPGNVLYHDHVWNQQGAGGAGGVDVGGRYELPINSSQDQQRFASLTSSVANYSL